ncbi:hypothetical protein KFU94_39375 [Chloroflexi bacterium TSY]|nr:hypothetical protein [Chloroflexi bacterium TSY]
MSLLRPTDCLYPKNSCPFRRETWADRIRSIWHLGQVIYDKLRKDTADDEHLEVQQDTSIHDDLRPERDSAQDKSDISVAKQTDLGVEVEPLLLDLFRQMQRDLPYKQICVYVLNRQNHSLVSYIAANQEGIATEIQSHQISMTGIADLFMRIEAVDMAPNVDPVPKHRNVVAVDYAMSSSMEVIVPINGNVLEDNLVVVLQAEYETSHSLTQHDSSLLQLLANHLATLIDTLRLHKRSQQLSETLVAVHEDMENVYQNAASLIVSMNRDGRTLLHGIMGLAQILQMDENLTDEQSEAIGIIHDSGEKLLSLLTQTYAEFTHTTQRILSKQFSVPHQANSSKSRIS